MTEHNHAAKNYKGVRGGDPTRRPRKVQVEYPCPECGTTVSKVVDEGKPGAGLCIACQQAKSIAGTKAAEAARSERREALWRQRLAESRRTPEELNRFYAEYGDGPKETCEYCGGTYLIESYVPQEYLHTGVYNDPYREDAIRYVEYQMDPYAAEINHDWTMHWLCNRCAYEQAMDI